MELKDTVDLMLSDDWKDRLKAEFLQSKLRYEQLLRLISDLKAGKTTFDYRSKLNIDLFCRLEEDMCDYLYTLESLVKNLGINPNLDGEQ